MSILYRNSDGKIILRKVSDDFAAPEGYTTGKYLHPVDTATHYTLETVPSVNGEVNTLRLNTKEILTCDEVYMIGHKVCEAFLLGLLNNTVTKGERAVINKMPEYLEDTDWAALKEKYL